jgi:hypothetical protein
MRYSVVTNTFTQACQQNARIRTKNSAGVYFDQGDAYTASIISSYTYSGGNDACSSIKIIPKLATWGDGRSTDITSVFIEISYWFSKTGDSSVRVNGAYFTNTFELKIYPTAFMVKTLS